MEHHEVVIVGAGPAGLSAAVKCAKEGVKTLLIERRKIPSHKYSVVCALAGSNTLKKLYGVDASKFGGNPISNYAFFRHNYSVSGKINLNLNVKNFGIALTGKEFEEYMLGLADLNILQAIVTGCARKEGEIVLNLSNGESVKTKILIDASGPLREPSRMLGKGWNPKYSWTHTGYILEGVKPEEFGIDSETAANNFYPIDPYKQLADLVVEPLGQDKVGFTVHVLTSLRKKSIFPAEMPAGENLYSLCKNIAGETLSRIESEYREQIQKARKAHTYWGVLPHGIETPPYDDNLLIAGTAAGQGPYILDAGFLNFCLCGSMAGDVVVRAITEENYSKNYLKRYKKMVDSYPAYFHPIIKHFVPRALFNMFNVPNVAKSVQDIFDSSALSSSLEGAVRVGLVRYEASVEDLINVLRLAFRCAVRTVKDKSLKDLAEIDWLETLFT